jgi:hypothetical protein
MPFAKRYAPTTLNDYIYTAVGAETSVSGADDNGDTLSYNPATVRVFLDGVRLDPADFTATNSTSITGLTALVAGQKITVDALGDSGNPIVSYTKTASDTKYALLGANSDITSLTGLTTPLSAAQGGTGGTSVPATSFDSRFMAYNDTLRSNVTGDATAYTMVFNQELSDVGSEFNTSTYTFTATTAGTYNFHTGMEVGGFTSTHDIGAHLKTSNRDYSGDYRNSENIIRGGYLYLQYTWLEVDMDAADTAYITLTISNGSKVIDVSAVGGANHYTYFSGQRVS